MDLEAFFTRHRIEFRTQGPNCSRRFVNIQCPICGSADQSFHLRINRESQWWYCLRHPGHKNSRFSYLLEWLGITDPGYIAEERPQVKAAPRVIRNNYALFDPAWESTEAQMYLLSRLFENPAEVCRKFDLRVAKEGKWAGRLLVPLTVGWTGRSMRSYILPRYLSEATEESFMKVGQGQTYVVVEGPIDALKLAVVQKDISIVAVTGGWISSSILLELRKASIIHYAPDSNVPVSQRWAALQDIRMNCPQAVVKNATIQEFKDLGEMKEIEVKEWVYSLE